MSPHGTFDIVRLGRKPWTESLVSWYHLPRQQTFNIGDIRSFWSPSSNDMNAEYFDGNEWIGIDYKIWTSDQTNNAPSVMNTVSYCTLNGTEISFATSAKTNNG